MSDPQPSPLFFQNFLKNVLELLTKSTISLQINFEDYYYYLSTKVPTLRWVELEYCIKYPLKILQIDQQHMPLFHFPRMGECKAYVSFINKLPDSQRTLLIKKISQLPMSIHIPALVVIGNEIIPDSISWKILCETISVYELPTQNCKTIISHLHSFIEGNIPPITGPVTLTQALIQQGTEPKSAIWELFKQNSSKAQISLEKSNKFPECKNISEQQDRSETVERSIETPNKFDNGFTVQRSDFLTKEKTQRESQREIRDVIREAISSREVQRESIPQEKLSVREPFQQRNLVDIPKQSMQQYKPEVFTESQPNGYRRDSINNNSYTNELIPFLRRESFGQYPTQRNFRSSSGFPLNKSIDVNNSMERSEPLITIKKRDFQPNETGQLTQLDYDNVIDVLNEQPKLNLLFD
ncbi:hypothetical protein EDI_002740 [Entamoeba dispar SAW760]|uniref:Uncharacterized protein n=1 Tax=Entamoeba dispar (strain ATCC PRA-260 / SAW760) TaxID=370354 RepID=B0EJA2_ENTDS|nr:uncharacterized protein EDI_002740 [Entamoeba dispar SAW760]EDR25410.1 hypothetical protein EDI_002740 [Entamoeba dispar SAW760]|eukprot:EDR25410.1 hypothetical protein EDI_002740 [Entamoeba dispar SAW760]